MAENPTTGTTKPETKTEKSICSACEGHGVRYDPDSKEGIGRCSICDGRGEIY